MTKPDRNVLISTVVIWAIVVWLGITYLATVFFPYVPTGEGPR